MATTQHHAEKVEVSASSDGMVNIEATPPHSRAKSTVAVIVNSELNPVNGFVDFLREHAIVGLAIGFVIGTQVQALVKQLVSSFISPLFNLFFGQSLESRSLSVHYGNRVGQFSWGSFTYSLLNFLFVVATIYMIIKFLKLDKLDKPSDKSTLVEKAEDLKERMEQEATHERTER